MSPPLLVVLVAIMLAVTVFLLLIIIIMKMDINRVIILPQDPIYSFQDVVHKAIVLRDVNRRNSIVTAGLKGTFTTITTISQKIKNLYFVNFTDQNKNNTKMCEHSNIKSSKD